MAGSATLTTVESTVTTVVPRIAATSVRRLLLDEAVPTSLGHQADGPAPLTASAARGSGPT